MPKPLILKLLLLWGGLLALHVLVTAILVYRWVEQGQLIAAPLFVIQQAAALGCLGLFLYLCKQYRDTP